MSTAGMKTNGTSLNDQNEKNKRKWGGDTINFDINAAVNGFDANRAEYNAAGTSDARKAAINALYGGNIMNYNSGADVYADWNRDVQSINTIDSYNSALEQSKKTAAETESKKLQYADTRRQLMEKYLPETLLAQGVANTGYTADALLKAENNYNQYALGAMSEREASEQNAMQAYQDAMREYKGKQAEKAYEDFLGKQKDESTLYSNAISALENDDATIEYVTEYLKANGASQEVIDKATKYYNDNVSKVQTELYNTIVADGLDKYTFEDIDRMVAEGELSKEMGDSLKRKMGEGIKVVEGASMGTWSSKIKDKEGDNFIINFNNYDYKFQNGGKQTGAILDYAKEHFEDGTVFQKDDKAYIYKDGNVYLIKARPVDFGDYKFFLETIKKKK